MKRRDLLASAAAAAGAGLGYPAFVTGTERRQFTMVTDYPDGPGILPSARRLARAIARASGGRISIEVTAAGEVVRPLETFDAVQAGVADMFHSHIGYFDNKSPALHFYSGVPFGFTAQELLSWVRFGGGQELWDELGSEFNIKPLLACSTGTQMGGWFTREISSTEAFRGLRYRMAEPGAEVYRRLGATVVMVPGTDIVQALRSGAIDACEWIGPWMDMEMGLHEAASYYYYPGWHEPGTALALGINRGVWDSLDEGDRQLIEIAAGNEYAASLAEFDVNNALALRRLQAGGVVNIRRFDDRTLSTFAQLARDVVAEMASGDALARKVYASYLEFRRLIRGWTDIAEGAYLGIRSNGE